MDCDDSRRDRTAHALPGEGVARGGPGPAARRAAILAAVHAIPEGWVRTYADVCPGAPRLTGAVLRGARDIRLPWHRVVRADGSLTQGDRQRALLEAEGVPFGAAGRVELRVARLPQEPFDVDPS